MGSAGVRVWACALAATVLAIGVVQAATYHVPGEYATIQGGIDRATEGDTVLVACGTYYEHDIEMKTGICIDFTVPTSEVLDISARVVRDLFGGTQQTRSTGAFSFTWDGRDNVGRRVAAGVYVVRVEGAEKGGVAR